MKIRDLNKCLEKSELIYNNSQIKKAILQQAEELDIFLQSLPEDSEPALILPVMNGGLIYAGQLLPLVKTPVQVDYLHATRYQNTTKGYELEWKVYPQQQLNNRIVILLDDILDEGHTLDAIVKYCHQQGASKVLSAVLVTKQHDRRDKDIVADFSALDIEDRYVFGFGMDYKGQLRNLDSIYAL